MIFQHTWKLILARKKWQTRRLWHPYDEFRFEGMQEPGVYRCHPALMKPMPRWLLDHTYAIQQERCHPSLGRWPLVSIKLEPDPMKISDEDAVGEGFPDAASFRAAWSQLHRKNSYAPAWALKFDPALLSLTPLGKQLKAQLESGAA